MTTRKFLAVLLIISLQSLGLAGLIADFSFKLNARYIAKVLCENRAKPELSCLGKCYLKKILKKAEEQKEASTNLLKQAQFVAFIQSEDSKSPVFSVWLFSHYILNNHNGLVKGWPLKTFHPPGLSLA